MSFVKKLKNIVIGKAKNPHDPDLFHKLSLIAFFAWVGLGADGLTSSCYGPEEAFLALGKHMFLGIFVAIGTAFTIFIISTSYSHIIELFPAGGGGYLVASKLLTPSLGMVSGCALLIDYVLTITLSIASGADALFSFFPPNWHSFRLSFAVFVLIALTIINTRGVKESVIPLVPIFLVFMITHVFAVFYVFGTHFSDFGTLVTTTVSDIKVTKNEIGVFGMILLILRAYSMGAGTFTGIEAVSNGIPILRDPKIKTAKKTMRYMSVSLAFMVIGLMMGYLFFKVGNVQGKTLNAVLFEKMTSEWGNNIGHYFVMITLISEAVLLFVAAQTGFLDGPRVLGNMATDRWFPAQFSILSERFVTQNGVLLMGAASFALMTLSHGSVKFLVILYSINVFITFFLSQLGMVRHWWISRKTVSNWTGKILVNGIGLILTSFILISVVVLKFFEGGWITILITGSLVLLAIVIKNHYRQTLLHVKRLDNLIDAANISSNKSHKTAMSKPDTNAKTAVVLVNGYNGLGLHTLFNVLRLFGENFKNYLFVNVGIIDSGNFKGIEEIKKLEHYVKSELNKYVLLMRGKGLYAEGISGIGVDMVDEIRSISENIYAKYPQAVFFGGQMVFPKETIFTRLLHNHAIFAIQRKLYQKGIPILVMPIRVS